MRGKRKEVTEDVLDTICRAISQGNTREAAAAQVGMSREWLYKKIGEDEQFARAIEKADADAEMRHVANIEGAASEPKNWTASAWWLERRRGKDWGRVEKVQTDVNVSGEIGIRVTPWSPAT